MTMMTKTAVGDMEDPELIDRWQAHRDEPAYDELKNRHGNMVYHQANRYRASSVPQPAIEGQAWNLFDQAVDDYDPSKGAKFPTYLNYRLRRLDRFNKKYQNIARIPEQTARKIGDVQTASESLQQSQNKMPSAEDIAQEAGVEPDMVEQIQKLQRKDLYEGQYEGQQLQEGTDEKANKLLHDIRGELAGQEREVFDRLTGMGGAEKVDSKKELARQIGLSPGRVSQITSEIARKIKPHLHRL